jgi:dienelactone hydrolase
MSKNGEGREAVGGSLGGAAAPGAVAGAAADAAPDELVRVATGNWGPRIVANGTDYADFVATMARVSRWEDWCREWGGTAGGYEALAQLAEERGRRLTAAGAWRRAGLCWHWGKFLFSQFPDQQRAAHERAVACYARGTWALDPPAQRVEIPYQGTTLAAYLRQPAGGGQAPLVLMIPGLDSVKEELQATAEHFLARGLAILAVDGPGQGEAEYDLPIEPAYERVGSACLDWLEGQPELRGGPVGVYGVSLGGYYAARVAAFEPRVRATIALAGPYSFDEGWEALPALTRAAFRQRSGAASDEQARERAAALTLAGAAERITSPLLVITGKRDRVIPWEQAERLATEAPGAELVLYDDGNHGLTNRPYESRTRMADWLAERLRA